MVVYDVWCGTDNTLRRQQPSNRPGETRKSRHRWSIALLEKSGLCEVPCPRLRGHANDVRLSIARHAHASVDVAPRSPEAALQEFLAERLQQLDGGADVGFLLVAVVGDFAFDG